MNFLLAANWGQAQNVPKETFYLGGIQVGESDQSHWTSSMMASGMNTVEVTVYARQGEWDSDQLWFEEQDIGAMNQIRAAKKANMHVILVLRIALDHAYDRNKFLWHGMIMPRSKQALNAWFQQYTDFVLKWSKIAEDEGVDAIAIGSELNALSATVPLTEQSPHHRFMRCDSSQRILENRALKYKEQIGKDIWIQGYKQYDSLEMLIDDRIQANIAWAKQITYAGLPDSLERMNERRALIQKKWLKLIRKTRRQFSGQLTYAANFDNYFEVNFWEQLDFIGINAYFPLRQPESAQMNNTELRKHLKTGWEEVFQAIDSFCLEQQITHMPLLFTELGYTNYADATTEPWSGFGYSIVGEAENEKLIVWNQQKLNPEERAIAIETLHAVVQSQSIKLQGLLYWKFTTMASQLSIEPFAILLNTKVNSSPDPGLQSLQLFAE
ncbi:MAG: hypothetical protein ACFHU9_10685 [Fluviicola sp.]